MNSISAGRLQPSGLLTPFETWCEEQGVHPETPGAWDFYTLTRPSPPPSAHLDATA